MMRAKQQSRFLANLLALAVFFSQTSVVLASFDMFPANDNTKTHCMMMEAESANADLKQDQAKKAADCCETSGCANNYCVPGFSSSSSVIFNSITLLHSSLYAQTVIETTDQSQTGIDSSSPYRPPRHNA